MTIHHSANSILETIDMIERYRLDIRTVTMGISLLDCVRGTMAATCEAVYEKITTQAKDLVPTAEAIERELGIPIVNKRISVTPIALVAQAFPKDDPVELAHALDRAARTVGVNFIGGYSAIVEKGMTAGDQRLIRSIPRALTDTEVVCSSVNIGSSRAGINMDAVALMGEVVKEAAELKLQKHSCSFT